MINLLIVAGERTEKLAKFMRERGTFQVDFAYESLGMHYTTIKDSIINVDKILYLYQEGTINIRTDMQILKELLSQSGFFTTKEILFITAKCDSQEKAKSYFNAVMKDCNFTNYNIVSVGARPAFSDVYDALLGITKESNVKNHYQALYRVEKNKEDLEAFIAGNYKNITIEPFNNSRLTQYNFAKENARKSESGITQFDNEEVKVEQFAHPKLNYLNITNALYMAKVFILTGLPKTSLSTWTGALAVSAKQSDINVTVFDFSENHDMMDIFKEYSYEVNTVTMLDMLQGYEPDKEKVNLCAARNKKEENVRLEFLQNVFSNTVQPGFYFIYIPLHDFANVFSMLHNEIEQVLFGLAPIRSNIMQVQQLLAEYSEYKPFKVLLCDRYQLSPGQQYLDTKLVKGLLPFDNVKIVSPMEFTQFYNDASLIEQIGGN